MDNPDAGTMYLVLVVALVLAVLLIIGCMGGNFRPMKTTNDVSRVPLHYYGGKASLAPWIISYFPEHLVYLEPFCGGCSVILRKPKCPVETVNDLDGRTVNFFKVLRDRPEELIRVLELTPWARQEFVESLEMTGEAIEDARRFFVMSWMSFGGETGVKSYNFRIVHEGTSVSNGWLRIVAGLNDVASRLRDVQMENDDALCLVSEYNTADTLIYADPPYLYSTREKPGAYLFDMKDPLHLRLATLLRAHSGYVVLSGYPSKLYQELYEEEGWIREDKESSTTGHSSRIESLWLSPRTIQALKMPKQVSLF
jgi:DNA adenine methylase